MAIPLSQYNMIQQKAKSIKLIELEDYVTDYRTEYPYVHAVSSTIRFRLRSKLVADYEPIVLIEKL